MHLCYVVKCPSFLVKWIVLKTDFRIVEMKILRGGMML